MTIFIDTSALIAFMDADDDFHEEAFNIFSGLLKNNTAILVTNYIMLETIIILKNRLGLEAVTSFNKDILPALKIYWIDEEIHNIGVSNLIMANRKKVSLVDYTSFEMMKKLDIDKVFSFDNHFKNFGFEIIKS